MLPLLAGCGPTSVRLTQADPGQHPGQVVDTTGSLPDVTGGTGTTDETDASGDATDAGTPPPGSRPLESLIEPARPAPPVRNISREGPWVLPPPQTTIETYELTIPESAMQLFAQDVYAPEQPATFTFDGQSWPVSVRLRGASARTFPKKSWNVDFNDGRFQNREELNLVAEYQDQTMIVEKLAYDMLEAMHVPAPHTKFVRVIVNGQYQGVFLDVEEVDKKFLKAHAAPDTGATIYRCGGWDCEMKEYRQPWQGDWERATNKTDTDRSDLTAFLQEIDRTPEPKFAHELDEILDVEEFLRMMALEAIISNNFVEDSRSYWVADTVKDRWYYVPWDLNNADPRWWPTYSTDMQPITNHPLFPFTLQNPWLQTMYDRRSLLVQGYEPTFDVLRTRILAHPELRARLLKLTERARIELLDPATTNARIEQMHAFLEPYMQGDPYMDLQKFELGLPYLKKYVTGRNAFIVKELQRLRAAKPALVIEAFDPAAGTLELRNRGPAPVDTTGKVLTTNLRHPRLPLAGAVALPAMVLPPDGRVQLTAAQLGVSFASHGEVGIFDGTHVASPDDFFFYGALPSGHYARDASGTWTIQP